MSNNPITRTFSGRYDVPALGAISCLLFLISIFLPAATLDAINGDKTYSIVASIGAFFTENKPLMGIVVLLFSICFPVLKYGALTYIWFGKPTVGQSLKTVGWLKILGKWSMLDVYVIAITTCTIQLGILGETRPEIGIYGFGVAILLSTIVISWVSSLCYKAVKKDEGNEVELPDTVLLPLGIVLSFLLFVGGLFLPVMEVDKLIFWENQYSILGGILALYNGDKAFLAALLALFVVLLPLIKMVSIFAIWWLRRSSAKRKAQSWLLKLDEWSMMDVFSLALLVVVAKITDMVDLKLQLGLWLLLGSSALLGIASWFLHRKPTSK